MPLQSREFVVWYWPCPLYIKPYALRATGDNPLHEWDKFDAYIKKEYPVQYFFRETVSDFFDNIRRRWAIIKYDTKRYIKIPRKEMRDKVFNREYRSLDTVIVEFCLECVIEYVDREKCFEEIVFDSNDELKTFAAQLKECHEYAVKGRLEIKEEIEKAWHNVLQCRENGESNSHSQYEKITEFENKLEQADTQVIEWVIKNRKLFWI
jgi:succinate dehydrogenase flavin-adding protein (antitoxin of CptAB toxin-antitoxin module)